MPKSIAIPTKSGANAIEIGLNGPIAQTAKAAHPTRPTTSVSSTAHTVRNDLNPSASQKQSSPTESAGENPAPSDNVENWSSERATRSEEHTSELQSLRHLVCRLLLE